MSAKKRKSYSPEFKIEAVELITEKGYSIADASRSLGVEYSVLRRWNKQFTSDPERAFPGRERLATPDDELRQPQCELERVIQERDILKKRWPTLPRIKNEVQIYF